MLEIDIASTATDNMDVFLNECVKKFSQIQEDAHVCVNISLFSLNLKPILGHKYNSRYWNSQTLAIPMDVGGLNHCSLLTTAIDKTHLDLFWPSQHTIQILEELNWFSHISSHALMALVMTTLSFSSKLPHCGFMCYKVPLKHHHQEMLAKFVFIRTDNFQELSKRYHIPTIQHTPYWTLRSHTMCSR